MASSTDTPIVNTVQGKVRFTDLTGRVFGRLTWIEVSFGMETITARPFLG